MAPSPREPARSIRVFNFDDCALMTERGRELRALFALFEEVRDDSAKVIAKDINGLIRLCRL